MKKKFSYQERENFHVKRMRNGLRRPGKMSKKESFSAGFIHRDPTSRAFNEVKAKCDKASFEAGMTAGSLAYRKAMNTKF